MIQRRPSRIISLLLSIAVAELTRPLLSLSLLVEFLLRRWTGVVFGLVVLVLVSQVALLVNSDLVLYDCIMLDPVDHGTR